jgi:hypothetical protein
MESADKTAERLEMAAVKTGNHAHMAVDNDWFASQIDCLCQWQFVNCFPIILNCLYCIIECQIGHLDEPCLLSSVEIRSSSCSVIKDGGNPPLMREVIKNKSVYGSVFCR